MIQTFKAFYFPNKSLQLKLQAEYLNNEITPTVKSELFFLDLGISYSYKQLEFTFDWNNIFNEKDYSYVIYSGLDSYSYNYKLRPESLFVTIKFKY
jgi:outer membrane receptor protein involved in Fe transport